MPSNERVRLDHGEELTPINQSGQRDERQARRVVGPPRLDLPFEVQRQLLAEGRFSAASRPRGRKIERANCRKSPAMRTIVRTSRRERE